MIPADPELRMAALLDTAWAMFIDRFVAGRHEIRTEAPFQLHFAALLAQLGQLYCLDSKDIFRVDVERTYPTKANGSLKYVDIVCEAEWWTAGVRRSVTAPIEMKFKTARQGAQDHGRIDAYVDIEAVERVVASVPIGVGRFYMITDCGTYTRRSSIGVGTVFPTHDGCVAGPCTGLGTNSKGRQSVKVSIRGSYPFNWHPRAGWWFLAIPIGAPPSP